MILPVWGVLPTKAPPVGLMQKAHSRGTSKKRAQSTQLSWVGIIPDCTDGTRVPSRSDPHGGLSPLSRARNPDGRTATPGPLSGGTDYTLNLTGIVRVYVVNSYLRHSGLCVAVRVSSDYPSVRPTSI
jgi:hypothetical protein